MEHWSIEDYKNYTEKGFKKHKYKADFIIFNNDGTQEIIDVKGFKTKEYITKKKVFEDKFNLKITEI